MKGFGGRLALAGLASLLAVAPAYAETRPAAARAPAIFALIVGVHASDDFTRSSACSYDGDSRNRLRCAARPPTVGA